MDFIRRERGDPDCVQLPAVTKRSYVASENFVEDTIDERDLSPTQDKALASALQNVRRASRVRVPVVRIETETI